MPVIVKAPNDEVVLSNERLLVSKHRVVILLEFVRLVEMAVERRLVSNDQVHSCFGCFPEHLVCRHHCGRDSCNLRAGIAGLERIDRLAAPGHSNVLLNSLDYLPGRDRLILCVHGRSPKGQS